MALEAGGNTDVLSSESCCRPGGRGGRLVVGCGTLAVDDLLLDAGETNADEEEQEMQKKKRNGRRRKGGGGGDSNGGSMEV